MMTHTIWRRPKIVSAVKEFGFSDPKLAPELFKKKKNIIRMGKTPMRIEIILDIDGVEFRKCYTKKITTEIDEIKVNIISLTDLKTNKKASGRNKDLAD
jgi:hypothetical protein